MKIALRIYKWIILSVFLQVIFLYFINSFYLTNRTNIAERIKVTHVGSTGTMQQKDIKVELPSGASNISISYDNTYVSYILNGKLEIMEIQSGEVKKVIENYFVEKDKNTSKDKKKGNFTCYKWLPDKNLIMYGLSAPADSSPLVQLYTYDMETGNEHVGAALNSNYLSKGSELVDIEISPLNMVTYLKIKTGNNQAKLYRTDIMDDINTPITTSLDTVVKIGFYTEDLVYQDNTQKIFVKKGPGSAARQIFFDNKTVLIDMRGVEAEGKDKVFVGELDGDGKINKILYGGADEDTAKWTQVELKKPIALEDIVTSRLGTVYEVIETENVIYDPIKDSEVKYSGKFVGLTDGYVATIDKDILKLSPFSE